MNEAPPYVWKAPGHGDQFGLCDEWFLIHYGWRGTYDHFNTEPDRKAVSNPLRVEGDLMKTESLHNAGRSF